MKRALTLASLVLLAGALTACSAHEPTPTQHRPALKHEASLDLEGAPDCDVETACPEGLECIALDLEGGFSGTKCLDGAAVCEALDCGDGECLVLESYPARVVCSGAAGGGDGDDADGDEPVCSGDGC